MSRDGERSMRGRRAPGDKSSAGHDLGCGTWNSRDNNLKSRKWYFRSGAIEIQNAYFVFSVRKAPSKPLPLPSFPSGLPEPVPREMKKLTAMKTAESLDRPPRRASSVLPRRQQLFRPGTASVTISWFPPDYLFPHIFNPCSFLVNALKMLSPYTSTYINIHVTLFSLPHGLLYFLERSFPVTPQFQRW